MRTRRGLCHTPSLSHAAAPTAQSLGHGITVMAMGSVMMMMVVGDPVCLDLARCLAVCLGRTDHGHAIRHAPGHTPMGTALVWEVGWERILTGTTLSW